MAQWLGERARQDSAAVFLPFAAVREDFQILEIQVPDPQPQRLRQPEPRAVEHLLLMQELQFLVRSITFMNVRVTQFGIQILKMERLLLDLR